MMTWIQTFSGVRFHPLDPRPEDVRIEDIAHALSLKCRFGGHCRRFYSVAEHAVRVSHATPPGHALWGLMHDAGEAYLPDVGAPIKDRILVAVPGGAASFREAEDRVLTAVAAALGFADVDYDAVRNADLQLLATEARDLMAAPPEPWNLGVDPLPDVIVPVGPDEAERWFMRRWEELRPR